MRVKQILVVRLAPCLVLSVPAALFEKAGAPV
jgi:hypothetical protein